MAIRRSVRLLVLWVLVSVFSSLSGNALAGGYETLPASPWMMYFGAFSGYYHAAYQYESLYLDSIADPTVRNQIFNNDIWQRGMSWGGQIGIQYHFVRPYFIGLNFSGMGNTRKAQFNGAIFPGFGAVTFPLIETSLEIDYNLDLAAVFGIDVTPMTHIYVKGGGSYARLVEHSSLTVFNIATRQKFHYDLWGFVLGLGLSRDICRRVSLFAEYDFYDYGNQGLNTLTNLTPEQQSETYTQSANNIRAYTIRAGINVNFDL